MKRIDLAPVKVQPLSLPLFLTKIQAGFPSPADDYLENTLDLNDYLVKKPAATFLVRVTGDSMINAGIHHGNLLIVDRSLRPRHDSIILANLGGEFTVKRLYQRNGMVKLVPENKSFPIIDVTHHSDFEICGVVVHTIKSFT
jgi:DNA polymerase V